MRRLPLALVLLLLVAFAAARAEDPVQDPVALLQTEVKDLHAKVKALEGEVQYLLSREADLTAFALGHDAWSKALASRLQATRAQGFLARAIPESSRQSLLEGLDGLARALGTDLPAVTKEQQSTLREAQRER